MKSMQGPIRELINYWEASSTITKIDRKIIPGYSSEGPVINPISENLSKELIKLFSAVVHEPAKSTSVEKWNKGWGQNYEDIKKASICPNIVPYYFGKYPINRIFGKLYIESSSQPINNLKNILKPRWDVPAEDRWNSAEHNLVRLLMHNLVYIPLYEKIKNDKRDKIRIYEFGSGTAHNLYFLKKFMDLYLPSKRIIYVGLDWSKSTEKIINYLGSNFEYHHIDYYKQNTYPELEESPYLFSLASFEQINSSIQELLQFISSHNPKLVINIEPIYQTLNKYSFVDEQSIEYMKKRNYLPNFIGDLLNIKMLFKNSINLSIMRSGVGSQFIDGYTVVRWSC